MNKRIVLDHFGLVDRELRLYIAVGPYHPPHGYIAYLKYVPGGEGPWRKHGVEYSRVLSIYSPYAVDEPCRHLDRYFDPLLGCEVPILRLDRVVSIVDPRDVAKRVLATCRDELECVAAELISDLVRHGLSLECVGVTGSIMFGIHVAKHSDIDLVVYGEKCVEKALEVIPTVAKPIPRARLELVIDNLSHVHGVSRELAKESAAIRRWVYEGIEVTTVYTWSEPWSLRDPVKESRCVSTVIEVEPGDVGAVMYPAKFLARLGGEEVEVWSFEATLSTPMVRGGRFRVEGVLQVLASGRKRLVLGARECPSAVERVVS